MDVGTLSSIYNMLSHACTRTLATVSAQRVVASRSVYLMRTAEQ